MLLTVSWPKPHRRRASGRSGPRTGSEWSRQDIPIVFCCLEFQDTVCFHFSDPYLNDVNFFSAVIPHFKLLAVSSYVFCDPNSTHLDKNKPNLSYSSVLIGLHLSPGHVCFVLCSPSLPSLLPSPPVSSCPVLPPSVPLSPCPVLWVDLQTVRRAQRILHDPHHVVYPVFESLPSGRLSCPRRRASPQLSGFWILIPRRPLTQSWLTV